MRRLVLAMAALLAAPGAAAAADCADWVATAVSVQGAVEVRRAQAAAWEPAALGDRYCPGDALRVRARSRAAVVLRNDAVLRLDQNTTITFASAREEPTTWIELLRGTLHLFSRLRRGLMVTTAFVNALVEGTEFWVEVGDDQATVKVAEGRVVAENPAGRLVLASGQSAIARAGQAPAPYVVVSPRGAVQWALYYPAVASFRPEEFADPAVRASAEAYRRGDLREAVEALEALPPDVTDPRVLTYRAALLLSVGRADEARADLERALARDPRDARALALLAAVALGVNDEAEATRRAREAVQADPNSAAARVALSYAEQARFDLRAALRNAEAAVRLEPENALAWARLAELQLAFGRVKDAKQSAERGAALDPSIGRTQTVLGFAELADLDTKGAREAFERAIRLDQADPLPRLGLGLARIRRGDLEEGRREIELAAGLDPGNGLVRSYLGKAYYEERRADRAAEQFSIAKELDPNDPTPWFYDATLKQTENRPVEALRDLEKAIELNENRAVFRSPQLLEEDLAARGAALAQVYQDLGFEQRALLQGTTAVNIDPGSPAAHRFLADAYSVLPRHEIARVSERFQSLLLEPLVTNPVLPSGVLARPFILRGTGPTDPGFNEFDVLFNRDRASILASGVAGGNDTVGDEVAVAGLYRNLFLSAGQFHYETDGFRPNNDLNSDAIDVVGQVRLTRDTSLLAGFRYEDVERGDLQLRFDGSFLPGLRVHDERRTARLGLRHQLTPGSELLGSVAYVSAQGASLVPLTSLETDEDGYAADLQYILRAPRVSVIAGATHTLDDLEEVTKIPSFSLEFTEESIARSLELYLYSLLHPHPTLTVTAGVSGAFVDIGVTDRDQANPKVALTWTPLPGTAIRAAAFRTLTRTIPTAETLEPTQVAGFNQFFNDFLATEAWRYGAAVDQRLPFGVYVGGALTLRKLEVPFEELIDTAFEPRFTRWQEELHRAYVYWAVAPRLAARAEYVYERLERDNPLGLGVAGAGTHRVPLGLDLFGPAGLFARLTVTGVDQSGTFTDPFNNPSRGRDTFWIADASVGYRLPRRLGVIAVEGRNLFGERFSYQETDPANPSLAPERLLLVRLTLAY